MSRKRLTREDSRDRTTQRLLAAARKLIAKRGLSDTTLEDIAEEAGCSVRSVFWHFSDLDVLSLAAADYAIARGQAQSLWLAMSMLTGRPAFTPT